MSSYGHSDIANQRPQGNKGRPGISLLFCPFNQLALGESISHFNLPKHSADDLSILGLLYASTECTRRTTLENGSFLNLEPCVLQDSTSNLSIFYLSQIIPKVLSHSLSFLHHSDSLDYYPNRSNLPFPLFD